MNKDIKNIIHVVTASYSLDEVDDPEDMDATKPSQVVRRMLVAWRSRLISETCLGTAIAKKRLYRSLRNCNKCQTSRSRL